MDRQVCIVVRGARDGDIFRGGIDLPTQHGIISVHGEVPAEALREWASRAVRLMGSLRSGSVGDVMARRELVGELVGHAEEVGSPLLGQLANGAASALGSFGPLGALAGTGLRGLVSLFGGGAPQPRTRAGNLPPVGSVVNRARLLGRVGVVPGMSMQDVAAKLRWGLTQDWAWDLEDVRTMLANVPPMGSVRDLESLARQLGEAPALAPAPSPAPGGGIPPQLLQMFQAFMRSQGVGEDVGGVRRLPAPRARSARPARTRRPGQPRAVRALPGTVRALAAVSRGSLPAAVIAPTLAGAALLTQAAALPLADDRARVASMAARALDARAGAAAGDPASMAALEEAFADSEEDPEVAEALEIADAFGDQ